MPNEVTSFPHGNKKLCVHAESVDGLSRIRNDKMIAGSNGTLHAPLLYSGLCPSTELQN
jgi:hypothetical protein